MLKADQVRALCILYENLGSIHVSRHKYLIKEKCVMYKHGQSTHSKTLLKIIGKVYPLPVSTDVTFKCVLMDETLQMHIDDDKTVNCKT